MSVAPRQIFQAAALQRHLEAAAAPLPAPPRSLATSLLPFGRRRPRVPLILQQSANECGLACLAMILGYYGRTTRLPECRRLYDPGRDGISAAKLAQLARDFGLQVKGLSLNIEALAELARPVIAHWGFDHFVVVEWVDEERVGIVDPGWGRRTLSRAEFSDHFTGVVLTFAPGEHFAQQTDHAPPAWRAHVLALFRRARGSLAQILAVSALLQVFGLAVPAMSKLVVDRMLPAPRPGDLGLGMLGGGIVLWVTAFAAMTCLRQRLLVALQARLDAEMMTGFFQHLLRLPFRFFQQRPTGDLLARLRSNGDIREALTGQTVSMAIDSSLVLCFLGVLLVQEPRLALWTLGLGAAHLLLVLGSSRRVSDLMQRELTAQAESQSFLVEALKGIATIKVAGSEEATYKHWSRLHERQLLIARARGQLSGSLESALVALRLFAPLSVLWIGAERVLAGTLTPGSMLALCALSALVLAPLGSLAADVSKLQLVGAHLDRLADVLEAPPEQEATRRDPGLQLQGRLSVRDLHFRYAPAGPWALRNINLEITPGQKVALVGRTGSGKTTLAMLLLGLYTAEKGEVLFDGARQQDLDYHQLRRQMGVVLQEPFLFSGSVRDNIALGTEDASVAQIETAAKLAAIHDDILQMPMTYKTRVTEGSGGLSGGQRQRLAIARALCGRPPLLLFDEATSHLDTVTEQQVDANISALRCTRIVIAHRLSTICNADQIIVLDKGQIVQRGTHAELLAQGGHYAELVGSMEPQRR